MVYKNALFGVTGVTYLIKMRGINNVGVKKTKHIQKKLFWTRG